MRGGVCLKAVGLGVGILEGAVVMVSATKLMKAPVVSIVGSDLNQRQCLFL